jgi:hypothetical protein
MKQLKFNNNNNNNNNSEFWSTVVTCDLVILVTVVATANMKQLKQMRDPPSISSVDPPSISSVECSSPVKMAVVGLAAVPSTDITDEPTTMIKHTRIDPKKRPSF